ncbi:Het-C-domain-containing protein [Stemphylium lycopersici]|uniref:Het-C-domain-containing protein n=1 Tax=Stemphylium lycopersici TaxID=183478 RepID=A0A364N6H2_STELY|nr:Het-C-domain-containing protein [Stemphylium lycopersici]
MYVAMRRNVTHLFGKHRLETYLARVDGCNTKPEKPLDPGSAQKAVYENNSLGNLLSLSRDQKVVPTLLVDYDTYNSFLGINGQLDHILVRFYPSHHATTIDDKRAFIMYTDSGRAFNRPIWSDADVFDIQARSNTIRVWLTECEAYHPDCQKLLESNTPLSARILTVEKHETRAYIIKLISTRDIDLHKESHVILSHVWGDIDVSCKTTRAKVCQYFDTGIDFDTLPKTFQDAICITAAVGFRYIWIDSLCIIQDDKEDWQRESAKMAAIFRAGTITLSATCSFNSRGGCGLSPGFRPAHRFPKADSEGFGFAARETEVLRRSSTDVLEGQLRHGPVNGRAWILQEKMLSRRILHATSSQFVWQCNTITESEDGMLYEPKKRVPGSTLWGHFSRVVPSSQRQVDIRLDDYEFDRRWWRCVQDYSKRSLRYPSDQYAALAGVVQYHQEISKDSPVVGLWKHHLVVDLAWKAYRDTREHSTPLLEPGERRPSWTWMSFPHGSVGIRCPIDWYLLLKDDSRAGNLGIVYQAEVLHTDVKWNGEQLTSDPSGSTVCIQGIMRRMVAPKPLRAGIRSPLHLDPGVADPSGGSREYDTVALVAYVRSAVLTNQPPHITTVYLVLQEIEPGKKGLYMRAGRMELTEEFDRRQTAAAKRLYHDVNAQDTKRFAPHQDSSTMPQISDIWLPCLILLVFWARPTAAFGAGNIASLSAIEGQNWRHGDIEDTLLTLLISSQTGKKFSKMDVKRVYFGNWLRDYSQAVDVGTVKMVSAEAIRILLWVLGFMSFGYGTKEFEVTRDRLGCYRPEEHIDNPKLMYQDYADNLDARDYDRRLRGPIDERRELSVDERTGLKNYIASEDMGITTSAGMVRDLLRRCIDLGQRSGGRGPDFHEALRLLGTATHCLEDYAAHSNYVELALIELGEQDIFPHVGSNARFEVEDAGKEVYPIVTGTFGGVDFLHSVCGEITDKATQSELQELEGAISNAERSENKSKIKELLSQLPEGIFGGKDESSKADELEENANAAAMGNVQITPKEPEAFTEQIGELVKQIYPIMEFHDEIMQSIAEFIEKIPILPDLIEEVQNQVTIFVFSLLAPYVLPILSQVKSELETGSSEVIASSRDKQHIVFNDDDCTDPTHSMLSKDHFSNVLNEPAGQVASATIAWVVPQVVQCWDGEADTEETIETIIKGVFHHPATVGAVRDRKVSEGRQVMFETVRRWWESKDGRAQDEFREQLSRDGVESGRNHKENVHDKGHGCGKPLGMANNFGSSGGRGGGSNAKIQQASDHVGKLAGEAVGGGALGGLVGGLVGGIGGSILGDAFGDKEKKSRKEERYGQDGSYTQSYTETGRHEASSYGDSDRYGRAEYEQTQYPSGGRSEEYSRREQDERGGSYSYEQRVETSGYSGSGGYERHEERRVQYGNEWRSEETREGFDRSGEYYSEERERRGKSKKHSDDDSDDSGDEDSDEKRAKKERKRREKEEKKRRKHKKHGSGSEGSDDDADKRRSGSGEHRRRSRSREHERRREESGNRSPQRGGYGQEQRYGEESGYGRRQEGYGREESYNSSGGYGRQEESGYGRQEYVGDSYSQGYGQQGYAREESSRYGADPYSSGGYGRQEGNEYGGERPERGYGASGVPGGFGEEEEYGQRRQEYGSGGYGGSGGYDDEGYQRRY